MDAPISPTNAARHGIHACSWLFHEGKLHPYEFKRLEPGHSLPTPPQGVVNELGQILEQGGLSDIIGLQAYTGGIIGVESTDHDSHVSTTVDHDKKRWDPREQPNMQVASFAFFKMCSQA